ncbi:MAG: YgjV family protein [Ruminococcaceae bacterium]|nr:YgjV family protein [Oscillospiraceae bacterium]
MELLSYVFSIGGLLSMIIASLIKGKNMKTILLFVFSGSMLVATSYLLAGNGINGAISCYIGAAQTIINYFFDAKNKPLPRWLIAIYAVAFVVFNLVIGGFNYLCLLAIIASLTFILCIGQKVGSRYRFWTLVNMGLWCLYDVLSGSYGVLFTHGTQLVFAVIGMVIYDRNTKD